MPNGGVFGESPHRWGWLHVHASGIEPKTDAQGFERAFLAAPEQSQKQGAFRQRGVRDEHLLVGGEVVVDESGAARFNHFQITTEVAAGWSERAQGGARTMTE